MKRALATLISALVLPATAHADRVDHMTNRQLAHAADNAIAHGQVYSHRCGDASPWLKALVREMVSRAFAPYGTQAWALMVVGRESCFNPGAINPSSGTTGIAQIHPRYHTWINYRRVQVDMRYAVRTFVRLSRGGHNTGPWCLC